MGKVGAVQPAGEWHLDDLVWTPDDALESGITYDAAPLE